MPDPTSQKTQKLAFPATPRALRLALAALALLYLLYLLLAGLALPYLLRTKGAALASEALQRNVRIAAASFNPFTLRLAVEGIELDEADGKTRFAHIGKLDANVAGWATLWRRAPVMQSLRVEAPEVHLVRRAANAYNIDDLLALAAKQPPSPEPARFSLNNIELDGGSIDFDDLPEDAHHEVRALRIGLPFLSSLPTDVALQVEPHLSAQVNGAPFRLDGRAHPYAEPKEASLTLELVGIALPRYATYLPATLPFVLADGKLDAKLSAVFTQARDKPAALTLDGRVGVTRLALRDKAGKTLVALAEGEAVLGKSALLEARVALERIRLQGLEANLERAADGRLNLLPASSATAAPATETPAALNVTLGEFALRDATLRYRDAMLRAEVKKGDLGLTKLQFDGATQSLAVEALRSSGSALQVQLLSLPVASSQSESAGKPLAWRVGSLKLQGWQLRAEDRRSPQAAVAEFGALALSLDGLDSAAKTPAKLNFSATLNRGKAALDGTLALSPFAADLQVDFDKVDASGAQAYLADRLAARLARMQLSVHGRAQASAGKAAFRGDAALANFALADAEGKSDLLRWAELSARGIDFSAAPLAVRLQELALRDYFARIAIGPDGRINLQNLVKAPSQQQPAEAPATRPNIAIDKLLLSGGRVRFSDRFIKPNYNATLDALGGSVTGLSSDPAARAAVDLKGEVNDAPLTIAGKINPLAGDLAFDLKAAVRGMELAPLSPYASHYVGYAIDSGKLSFEVNYTLAQRKLAAQNRLVLDQLRFGEASTDPKATSMPVHFALALLQDRNGVVDVNLPVEGSLDDPQFSIGGIVVRMIANLVTKVVTSPFTLLSSVFGGGEEMSTLDFEAGRATVSEKGADKLAALAKALVERPALHLDITGMSDAAADVAGLRRAALDRRLRQQKQRELQARGQAVEGQVTVTPAEAPALLARVYAEEKFAKPKNIIGLAKSLPAAEMERLLLENMPAGADELRSLAMRRAENVRDALIKAGVPSERLYLHGARSGAARAEFSLK